MMGTYFPNSHDMNRMKNEGDVKLAREYFVTRKNRMLYHLIKQRFNWMNKFMKSDDIVMEIGSGAALSQFFIQNKNLKITDVVKNDWIDEMQDALSLDIPDGSQNIIICSEMIHHIANPACFLDNVGKKLKPGGCLVIQDIYTGIVMKTALRIMRHEGWSDDVNVFDRSVICNDPKDPWSANCSIPKLLFFNRDRFEREFPMFKMIYRKRNECFLFLASGGVIAKTCYLPVNDRGANLIRKLDQFLIKTFPEIFACGCSVVLQKRR